MERGAYTVIGGCRQGPLVGRPRSDRPLRGPGRGSGLGRGNLIGESWRGHGADAIPALEGGVGTGLAGGEIHRACECGSVASRHFHDDG